MKRMNYGCLRCKFMVSIIGWYRLIKQSRKPRKDSSLWSHPKLDYQKKINIRYLNYCQGNSDDLQRWIKAIIFCILHSKPCCVSEPKPFNLSWQNWLGSVLIFKINFWLGWFLRFLIAYNIHLPIKHKNCKKVTEDTVPWWGWMAKVLEDPV